MTITNGYAALQDFFLFATPEGNENALDDHVIEMLIEAASRHIDNVTRRTFYARTATRYFDRPLGRGLWLDDDLLTVTTLTNGDGVVIAASEYKLKPYAAAPYYALILKESSSVYFTNDSSGNSEGVISIAGTWGYAAAAPDDIKLACLLIARNIYRGRSGEASGNVTVTGAGVVITPKDVPQMAAEIMAKYARIV